MPNSFFPQIFSAVTLVLLSLAIMLLLWTLHREWWRLTWVRRAVIGTAVTGGLAVALWAAATAGDVRWLISVTSGVAAAVLTLLLALLLALPLSGLLLGGRRLGRRIRVYMEERRGRIAMRDPVLAVPSAEPVTRSVALVDRGRRSFVGAAAAVLPMATLSTAGYGLVSSRSAVRLPEIPLDFAGLHPALQGLRILHLTDLHLGYYVDLRDVEQLVLRAADLRADLVIVSGDVADDLRQLPDALRMIADLKPRYGAFVTLGNHEYFRGIDEVVRIMRRGPIPLLRNEGVLVDINGAPLYVGGADDPVKMGERDWNHRFLQRSIDAAFDGAPSDAFHLLASHRPEGFDVAREQGLHLTLSGHTHGGQLGFHGRSLLEPMMPNRYMWGHYRSQGSQLYTSAGVGHWFPFRLGCPPEAPLYILRRA